MQFINNNFWILCGHQNGHIVLWELQKDLEAGKPIKTITSHSSPVITLKFLKDARFISCDAQVKRNNVIIFNFFNNINIYY